MTDEIPRRARMEQWSEAERAIYDAMLKVEAMPADVRLTDAVTLLDAARSSVADFVDGIQYARREVTTRKDFALHRTVAPWISDIAANTVIDEGDEQE